MIRYARTVGATQTEDEVGRMNAATTIGILVVIVIVVIVVVLFVGRRRRLEANRVKATEIRKSAQDDAFAAREGEAKAASAAADAKQAEVDAERLRRESTARDEEANAARAHANEQLNKADRIDPDIPRRDRGTADGREGERVAEAGEREAVPQQPPVTDDRQDTRPPLA